MTTTERLVVLGGTVTMADGPALPIVGMEWRRGEVEYVRSWSAVLPDPDWSATDSHGHEHRWQLTGEVDPSGRPKRDVATLTKTYRHVGCPGGCDDDDCEGYSEPVWTCIECGDEVVPGYVPDDEARSTGVPIQVGPNQWTFQVDVSPEFQRRAAPGLDGTLRVTIGSEERNEATAAVVRPAEPVGAEWKGRGFLDFSGQMTVENGQPPTALVHFYPHKQGFDPS